MSGARIETPAPAFTDPTSLAGAISSRALARGSIVTIDGFDGVGKSRLALDLASRLGGRRVELDAFLGKNRGQYFDALNYPAVESEVADRSRLIFLEGLCIQKVLDRLGLRSSVKVYVMAKQAGQWLHERYVPPHRTADEVIAEQKDLDARLSHFDGGSEEPPNTLRHEIIRYHHEFKPHIDPDLGFYWVR